jgi:outer membrane protein TolC
MMLTLGTKRGAWYTPFLELLGMLAVVSLSHGTLRAQEPSTPDAHRNLAPLALPEAPHAEITVPTVRTFSCPVPKAAAPQIIAVSPATIASPNGPRRITLEEAQQQAAQAANPMARLGELSVEAAKQHRLEAQADYFPKLNASVFNLHFNKFMGEEFSFSRGTLLLPLVGKDQTIVSVMAAQPVTSLLKIREVVQLARADESIARAKAGMSATETANAVAENYYDLLVAQHRLTLAELNLRKADSKHLVAGMEPVASNLGQSQTEHMETNKAVIEASAKVTELTASLNELLGWPDDTRLELAPPAPLVEGISMKEAVGQAITTNPDVIEAEQNVEKARAGVRLSKLDYVPDSAILGGYAYQNNALPALPRDFTFIGITATYNLFDFGKREHTVKERSTQLEMAQAALELTRAKVAAAVKTSYFELERSRQLADLAHRMESAARTLNVKYGDEDLDVQASQAEIELDILQVDLEHREAYAKLMALMGE